MGIPGPQKINRCSLEFKIEAVQMSNQPGVLIKGLRVDRPAQGALNEHPAVVNRLQ